MHDFVSQSGFAFATESRIRARVLVELEELTPNSLRQELDLTQIEMGRALEMTQPELSRLENRNDHLASTFCCYVTAFDGELGILAVFDERRIRMTDA